MTTAEIYKVLKEHAFPVYQDPRTEKGDRRIYKELLKSLPTSQLEEILLMLQEDRQTPPWELEEYVGWMLIQEQSPARPVHRNESVTMLMRWFEDLKSGKVSYAYAQLKRRYPQQSYDVQKKILRLFLRRTTSSANWAAARLSESWIPSLADDVRRCWENRRFDADNATLARLVLRVLPKTYLLPQAAVLESMAGYKAVCLSLGNFPGFRLDESRLNIPEWFQVISTLRRPVKGSVITAKLNAYLSGLAESGDYPRDIVRPGFRFLYDFTYYILPSLRRLGATEHLAYLARLESRAAAKASRQPLDKRMACFLDYIHFVAS